MNLENADQNGESVGGEIMNLENADQNGESVGGETAGTRRYHGARRALWGNISVGRR